MKNYRLSYRGWLTCTQIEMPAGTIYGSWPHRPEMYEAYYKFLYPLHTEGVVEPALKELVRLKIAELNQCLF